MYSFQFAMDTNAPESFAEHALPWVFEAGNPYFNALFGSADVARQSIDSWLRRPTSEVAVWRTLFLMAGDIFVGGFIAMSGGDLKKARRGDSLALMRSASGELREQLLHRLENLAGLFPVVSDDEFYLSKVGLAPEFRGKGLGRTLVQRYIEEGARRGHARFRLDVCAGNEAAIGCYLSSGFVISQRSTSRDGAMQYLSMIYSKM